MRSVLLLLSLCTITPLVAQDWPQWLGPQRDGTINASIKPWQGALPVAWETKVGDGHSSPIVADGKVFLHDKAPGSDEEVITAWDLTGKQLWQERNTRAAFSSQFGVGPRATPAYSAGKLYTLGVTGILICRDANTGKEIWKNNLLESFSAKNLYFGVSSSPLVDDKNVYVMPGGTTGSIVALNKDTGSVFWKSGTDKASYSSPMMTSVDSKPILVFQTQAGVVGLKPDSGDELFRIPLRDLLNESSTTPVRVGDLLFASSVTFGSIGVNLVCVDGKVDTKQAWRNAGLTCYFGTPVVFANHLYAVTGQITSPTATLQCIDPKTGKSMWTKKGVGKYHATLLKTKEHLLMLEEGGDLVLVEPNTTEYKELARSKVCRMTWAHPAYANGLFIVRDAGVMKAIKLPAQ